MIAAINTPRMVVELEVGMEFPHKKEETGFIKVELWFETMTPKHLSSTILRETFGLQGPFLESTCILLPPARVFDMVEAYLDVFETLKDRTLLPKDAKLTAYNILPEDSRTLAWVIK